MKKCLLSFLTVGLMATASNAAVLGLRWQADPLSQNSNGGGTVEVWVDAFAGDFITGLNFQFVGDNPNLFISDIATTVPGWNPGGFAASLAAGSGAQFSSAAPLPQFNLNPQVNTSYILGTFNLGFTGPADGTIKEIMITAANESTGVGLLGAGAARLTWDSRYAATFSGYAAFGDWGNPGWSKIVKNAGEVGQLTPNPLLITKVPEPSSLALIALGGFALLRRR